jgi:ABC-type lipoprotein release transport system permease subunit
MAWRNLWRNRRRTAVTLSGIAFGTMLAILFTGLGDASWTEMIGVAARMGGGHVTVQHADALDAPSLSRTVRDTDRIRRFAENVDGVERTVPRIMGQTLLATAGQNVGAFFLAVDPAEEDEDTLAVFDSIVQGRMLEGTTGKGILVGERLAETLDVKLGRKVVYTLTDKQGEIVSGLARVSGIVRTGSPSVDAAFCLLPIDTVRELLGYDPGEVTQLAVFLGDHRKSSKLAARLAEPTDPDTAVLTWDRLQPELAGFISMKVVSTVFFELLIMVLVAAGIFNTLFVSVMERMREFGIMMAIGFSPSRLFGLVMWESLWLGMTGLAAAALVTAGPYLYLSVYGIDMSAMTGGENSEVAGVAMDPVLNVGIFPENAALIAVTVLLATLFSGIYPAWRAGRVVPVEAIKLV